MDRMALGAQRTLVHDDPLASFRQRESPPRLFVVAGTERAGRAALMDERIPTGRARLLTRARDMEGLAFAERDVVLFVRGWSAGPDGGLLADLLDAASAKTGARPRTVAR
ncbi:MAG: hypothetical protein M0P31_18795 [Solirubrobacteraceae bacterium]|nr:hypothetical protein [Solirubrobacteraceae bacterium]